MKYYSFLNCIFILSLKLVVSPPLIVLRSEIAHASCFATLLTDVLIAVTVFLILNHFLIIIMLPTKLKTSIKLAMRITASHFLLLCKPIFNFAIR